MKRVFPFFERTQVEGRPIPQSCLGSRCDVCWAPLILEWSANTAISLSPHVQDNEVASGWRPSLLGVQDSEVALQNMKQPNLCRGTACHQFQFEQRLESKHGKLCNHLPDGALVSVAPPTKQKEFIAGELCRAPIFSEYTYVIIVLSLPAVWQQRLPLFPHHWNPLPGINSCLLSFCACKRESKNEMKVDKPTRESQVDKGTVS